MGFSRQFRFLATILGVSLALGIYESQREDLPKDITRVDPSWLLNERVNLAQTLTDLYPNRSHGYFLRGYQAHMCWSMTPKYSLPVCWGFPNQDLRDTQQALEKAIELKGDINEEELYRFYANVLLESNAPPDVIQEAIAQWRRNYPSSIKPDPRTLYVNGP